ncbi:replication endonuclease [Spartinivicinus ruber]|uniref:replication endonuclease n=1 Tax=Spartinivicinus ruber TaxID=2683272 RepID=UPI0013D4A257|nr:replication endonuclease [Spartinivicinus ruber]
MTQTFVGFDGRVHKNDEINKFGTPDCLHFRDRILSKYLALAPAMRAEYLFIAENQSHVEANLRLLELDKQLHIRDFNLLADRDELDDFVMRRVENCMQIRAAAGNDFERAYHGCCSLAKLYEVKAPSVISNGGYEPCVNRFCCDKWWKRQLTKRQKTTVDSIARDLRQVHNHAKPYCSDIALKLHRQQKVINRTYLETQIAVNEEDQEYTLAELADVTVSNPAIRRMELITRIKGFEAIAQEMAHSALFITLTAPSRFHCMTKITVGGKVVKVIPNKNYGGQTPRDTQKYLVNLWAKIQAKLSREGIKPYGFRVAEPHHDATPHWHFLLFVEPGQVNQLVDIFQQWAMQDTPDEKGAEQHRVKVEPIKTGVNPKTGKDYSATGYIIKYVCKNIDGYGVDNTAADGEWADKDAASLAERIETWARTHRIRQFQQIGGPSVTVWREMRRLAEQEGLLEEVRQAADAGDWAAFVKAMGGPNALRKDQLVKPAYAVSKSEYIDTETGEIINVPGCTEYGDDAKERVIGVLMAGITVLSRMHTWQIKENENVRKASRKIMTGMVELLDEAYQQNKHELLLRRAKPAALDLCQ